MPNHFYAFFSNCARRLVQTRVDVLSLYKIFVIPYWTVLVIVLKNMLLILLRSLHDKIRSNHLSL